MKPYSTHIPLLLRCLENTSGPILEFGTGWFSTPLINAFAHNGRFARSIEQASDWAIKFNGLCDGIDHQLITLTDYDNAIVNDLRWSVCLIDHHMTRRVIDLNRIRHYTEIICIHDTEAVSYGLTEILDTFKHRYESNLHPQTTVVSDNRPLDFLREVPQLHCEEIAAFLVNPRFEGSIESGGWKITKRRSGEDQ